MKKTKGNTAQWQNPFTIVTFMVIAALVTRITPNMHETLLVAAIMLTALETLRQR